MQTVAIKKKADEPMTIKAFPEEMGINYRAALNWLREGLVPGAGQIVFLLFIARSRRYPK
jgi:hypothetical protein